jgi:hypothetical protein
MGFHPNGLGLPCKVPLILLAIVFSSFTIIVEQMDENIVDLNENIRNFPEFETILP